MFKSFLIAATFFASPGASQVLGNWDILYRSLATDFQHSVANELTLDYHIGKGRTYQVDLYEKNCVGSITGMTIIPTANRTTGVTANHDELEIMIDLDKSTITSSNIWIDSSLQFCVRLQLLSGDEVIKENKREIDISFDFNVDFDTTDVVVQSASTTSASGEANVGTYIKACKCDNLESFKCDTNPIGPNSILYVCLLSIDPDVEIRWLDSLSLFQYNAIGNKTMNIVASANIQNEEISTIASILFLL